MSCLNSTTNCHTVRTLCSEASNKYSMHGAMGGLTFSTESLAPVTLMDFWSGAIVLAASAIER